MKGSMQETKDKKQTQEESSRAPLAPSKAETIAPTRKPQWLKVKAPGGENYQRIKGMLRERNLHTVCEEARCPNVAECWAGGTATFMLGGDTCTRACRFCAVKTARRPAPLDPKEPEHVSRSIAEMKLNYVVLTSVDRDDLTDGGAEHFAKTIEGIKSLDQQVLVEALVPDFNGERDCITTVVNSQVDVYAHNIETVRELHGRVRDPRAGYGQSLETLRYAKDYAKSKGMKLYTKSSIMLGLGETRAELKEAFADLAKVGVDVVTLGQYLRPTKQHLPVEKFLSPEEFEELANLAREYGFLYVASGPMVRSSYKAAEFFLTGVLRQKQKIEGKETHGI